MFKSYFALSVMKSPDSTSSKNDPSPDESLTCYVWNVPKISYFPTKKNINGEALWHFSTIFSHETGSFTLPLSMDFLNISFKIALDLISHEVNIF